MKTYHNHLTSALEKQVAFLVKAQEVHGRKYLYTKTNYVNKSTPVVITCSVHGDFSLLPISHLRGSGCPACAKEKRPIPKKLVHIHNRRQQAELRRQQFADAFIKGSEHIHKHKYDYSKVKYVNVATPVVIRCPVHGEFKQTPKNHIKGQGCPACSGRAHYTTDSFCKRSREVHGELYDYTKVEYQHYHKPVVIGCAKHGWFTQTPNNHLAGSGCPKCVSKITSGIQHKVARWVAKYTDVITDTRTVLKTKSNKGLEIDIWCPRHRLGIEINGLHWHSEAYKKREYHYTKALVSRRTGINLLQFWEHELKYRAKICKSIISSHLGLSDRYYARQLKIQRLPSRQAIQFFEANHLQGHARAEVCYGLFNDTECLCAMSFGAPRFNSKHEWEIIRFANQLNTTVVGGASRLYKHFVEQHQPKSVVSYADLRISQGNLYRQLGFEFSHRSKPGYFWHNGLEILTRYKTTKTKLHKLLGERFDPTVSETDNMRNNGWRRVFDAGNLVYVWRATV